ncbi:hypothetical protein D3C87_333280 [compost metagenome]
MKIQIVILFHILFISKTNGQSTFNNGIFVEPLIKRCRSYNDAVQFSGSVDYSRVFQIPTSIITLMEREVLRLSFNLYGTRLLNVSTFTKPYREYSGNEKIEVQEGNPHPYPNYPFMGFLWRHLYRDIDDYPSIAKNMENLTYWAGL